MELKEMIAVMQAAEQGKPLQAMLRRGVLGWQDVGHSVRWNWAKFAYRVKPEPRRIWVNIYPDGTYLHPTRESAAYISDPRCIECVEFVEVLPE